MIQIAQSINIIKYNEFEWISVKITITNLIKNGLLMLYFLFIISSTPLTLNSNIFISNDFYNSKFLNLNNNEFYHFDILILCK